MRFSRLFLIILLLIPFSYAQTTSEDLDYVYKIGSNATEINRPCFNSGATGWCSSGARCQLTVTDPGSRVIVDGGNMTNQISRHNFTLPTLTTLGIYKADMACSDSNLTGANTFFFGVNNAGSDYNKNSSVMFILGILIGLMILFSLCAYFLNEWLRMSFLVLAVLMLPVTLWVSLDIARNSFMGAAVVNVMSTGFIVSLIGFVAIGLYVLIILLSQIKLRDNRIESKGSPLYWNKKQEYAKKHPDREFR